MAATPGYSQADNLGHSKECLIPQYNLSAQCNFVAYDSKLVAQPQSVAQCHFVSQVVYYGARAAECHLYSSSCILP